MEMQCQQEKIWRTIEKEREGTVIFGEKKKRASEREENENEKISMNKLSKSVENCCSKMARAKEEGEEEEELGKRFH